VKKNYIESNSTYRDYNLQDLNSTYRKITLNCFEVNTRVPYLNESSINQLGIINQFKHHREREDGVRGWMFKEQTMEMQRQSRTKVNG